MQKRYFLYDSLSRLIRAKNPEQDANASLYLYDAATTNGNWSTSYDYDANSNLWHKTDARAITVTYTYDSLNRVTKRDYSDTTPDVNYVYDPPVAYGKGKLSYVDAEGVSTYNYTKYDAAGRLLEYNQLTASQPYFMKNSYNLAGSQKSQEYPSGKVVETSYDAAGRIAGVKKAGDRLLRRV